MKKLLSILMIAGAIFMMPGCGDDNEPGGGGSCDNAANDAVAAAQAFANNINGTTCQAAVNAITAAINACDGVVTQAEIDDWNDFLNSDPCDGL